MTNKTDEHMSGCCALLNFCRAGTFAVALVTVTANLSARSTAATLTPAMPPFSVNAPNSESHLDSDRRGSTFSRWTKICQAERTANADQICLVGETGHFGSGVLIAMLMEWSKQTKKTLRVILPLGMQLQQGAEVVVDHGQPLYAPYTTCLQNGCIADFEANADLLDSLERGQGLGVQAISNQGIAVRLVLPLSSFAKAYDGPPTDPKFVEQELIKWREMQRAQNLQKPANLAKTPKPN